MSKEDVINQIIKPLKEFYGSLKPLWIKMYMEGLQFYAAHVLESAITTVLTTRTSDFPPTPGEVKTACEALIKTNNATKPLPNGPIYRQTETERRLAEVKPQVDDFMERLEHTEIYKLAEKRGWRTTLRQHYLLIANDLALAKLPMDIPVLDEKTIYELEADHIKTAKFIQHAMPNSELARKIYQLDVWEKMGMVSKVERVDKKSISNLEDKDKNSVNSEESEGFPKRVGLVLGDLL